MSDSSEKDQISIGTGLIAAVKVALSNTRTLLFTLFIPQKLCLVSKKKEPFPK